MSTAPVIFWFRQDLRLRDNPALAAAVESGQPVIPVYILDDKTPKDWKMGGASRWWLHHSLSALQADLKKAGNTLYIAMGESSSVLSKLVKETGATDIFWNRCYEPFTIERDKAIKEKLNGHSFNGYLLFEPWTIQNKSGEPYKVFTPFSKACLERGVERPPSEAVKKIPAVKSVSLSTNIDDLNLLPKINWAEGIKESWTPGEAGAQERLKSFVRDGVFDYKAKRDFPAEEGVSKLSPHLHFGEVSPHDVWHTVSQAMQKKGDDKSRTHAQAFLRQLIWREFSWHLIYHWPDFPDQSWNKKFADFDWRQDKKALRAWQQGKTGYPIVDAGMRELWQTGWMHNRLRMIVGSFLVKHLLIHWIEGEKWFWDTLVDADLGNNAAGWQWIGGCGADAAPYFRIFNPILQSKKFDGDADYIRQYVPELAKLPDQYIHTPWDAPADVLEKAGVVLGEDYPLPLVDHDVARKRALETYGRITGTDTSG